VTAKHEPQDCTEPNDEQLYEWQIAHRHHGTCSCCDERSWRIRCQPLHHEQQALCDDGHSNELEPVDCGLADRTA
jgi:hypothetical protein